MEQTKQVEQTIQAENPLGTASIGRLLAQFAIPSVVSMLVNAIYNIVDQIFIGQGVGYLGNAATTIAFPVVTIILAVSTMLGAGGSAYAAIKLGEKKEEEARRTYGNVFLLSVMFGVAILILGLIFLDELMYLFGADAETIEYARQYTGVLLLGAPFNVLGISLSNIARTDGKPILSMISLLAGALLNIVLDPIFIFIFGWGVIGAAVATVISQVVSAVVLIWYFFFASKNKITRQSMRLSGRILRQTAALGFSSSVLHLANTVTQIIMNNSLRYYGDLSDVGGNVALSAMGIVMKTNMILLSICIGIGVGSQPILGYNRGAGNPRRIRRTYLLAAAASLAASTLGWIMCEFFPGPALSIFGTDNAAFSEFAVRSMRIFLGGVIFAGLQIVSTNYFQATGQPLKATLMSMMRQIILLIPLVLLLPVWFGLDGILYAGLTADLVVGLVAFLFTAFELRRLSRWIAQEEAGA